jgi:uncharacterized protein (DUF2141 family)
MIRQQSVGKPSINSKVASKVTQMTFFFKGCLPVLFMLLVLFPLTATAQSTLVVPIKGPVTPSGKFLYSLYKDGVGFPDKPTKAFRNGSCPAVQGENKIIIKDIPAGRYALAVIQDQNENGHLDKTEPFGFSNNVIGAFGPPKFHRAQFEVRPGRNELTPLRLRMGQ